MATGTLKIWNFDRGYGFIIDNSGGPDIFLHATALEAAGMEGQRQERRQAEL
jgi:CspA family cold shock protein